MMDVGKRAHVSRGGRLLGVIALVALGAGTAVRWDELGPAAWFFSMAVTVGIAGLLSWKSKESEELEAGGATVGGISEEELIETARAAIEMETRSLDEKRLGFAKEVTAYAEFMEYPDFEMLEQTDWASDSWKENDKRVREMLDAESDRMLAKFVEGDYWEEQVFQHKELVGDVLAFMGNVAKIYQPDAERPLLETNLEALLKAMNRASLQVLLLLEELPMLDVKDFNLRKMYEGVRKAGKVYNKFAELGPYLQPVRYLWQGTKFLFASNPLLAAGWIAGSELAWQGSKKWGKKKLDAYLLTLMKQSLGIIAWETAAIFDKTHRYRDADWIYAVELAHLVSEFPLTQDALRGALKELGAVPLRSSYDRAFLYRCVAQHVSPKPEKFAQPEMLIGEVRKQIAARLLGFQQAFELETEEDDKKAQRKLAKWRKGVGKRLALTDTMDANRDSETPVLEVGKSGDK
jgi:hypothetical protein